MWAQLRTTHRILYIYLANTIICSLSTLNCIIQRVHFQVGVGVFNCQQILTKISEVIFNVVVKNKSNVV